MPIFVTVMLALCNACWDLVLSRAAMLIKHVLCLVLPTDTTSTTEDKSKLMFTILGKALVACSF